MPGYVVTAALSAREDHVKALCVEAGISVEAETIEDALEALRKAVEDHYADASEDELDEALGVSTFITHFVADFPDEDEFDFEDDDEEEDDED